MQHNYPVISLYSILYVDDESSLLEICKLFLEQTGDFTVTTVLSAPEAIRLFEQEKFDAIISDYQMPGMDGIQFLVEVRKRFGQIPFILFTGKGREEVVIQALNEGADFYIQKGGDVKAQFAELSHKIMRAVSGRQAEDALRESERRMGEIIDNAPFGAHLYELKSEGKLVFTGANSAADRILNVKNQQFIGKTIEEAFPPLSQTDIPDAYRRVAATGEQYTLDQVDYADDGGIRGAFEVHAYQTGPNRMATFFRDITERKRAETELRAAYEQLAANDEELRAQYDMLVVNEKKILENEEHYRSLVLNIPGTVYHCANDPDWTMYYLSPEIEALSGYPASDFIQNAVRCYASIIHPDDRARVDRAVQEGLEKKRTYSIEYRICRPDGAIRWVFERGQGIFSMDGTLIWLDGVILDQTERKQAKGALQESDEILSDIIEKNPMSIQIVDGEGFTLRVNPAFIRLFGSVPPPDFSIITDLVKSHPELENTITQVKCGKTVNLPDMSFNPHDIYPELPDVPTRVRAIIFPLNDRHGKPRRFVFMHEDITEQRQAEEALRESEDRFRKIFDTSPVGMALVTPEFRFISVNPAFVSMTGYTEGELQKMTFKDITHPDHLAGDLEHMRELAAGTIPVYSTEKRYIRKDGSILWGFIRVTVLHDPAGSLRSFVAQIDDITERKQAEETLQRLDERFRAIFNATFQFTGLMKPDGTLTEANQSALDFCGITRDQIIGKPFWEACWWQGDEKRVNDLRKAIARAAGGEFVRYEVGLQGTGDNRGLFDFSIKPVFDTQGNVVMLVPEGRDITGRKRAEDALRQANKKLNLLSGITRHDIKNQILSLNGFLEISKKYAGNAAKMMEFITKEVQIANTIERQIAFAKEYENLGVAAPVWQDCRTLVEIAAKQAPLGNMPVKNDLPAGVEVFADPLIVRVFYNLMDNAVRYGGKITTIRFSVQEYGGDHILVCEDDGDGVGDEEKEMIFEQGYGKNTGMGLFLSREILSITGITIRETGEPGKGARFEMTVPKGAYRFPEMK